MRTWAHPIAIRERALAAWDAGMKADEVAKLFRVAVSVLYDWKRIRKERGSLAPLAHQSGNKPRVDADREEVVRAILDETPDATVREAAIYFVERTDRSCSRQAMGRALARMGITRKKSR